MTKKIKITTCIICFIIIILFLAREQHYKYKIIREVDGIRFVYQGTQLDKDIEFLKEAEKRIRKYTDKMYTLRDIDIKCLLFDIEAEYTNLEIIELQLYADPDNSELIMLKSRVNANAMTENLRYECEYMFLSLKRLYR